MPTTPSFPNGVWNGLTENPERTSRSVNQWCNHQDWNRISAEVIAIEDFLIAGSLAPPTAPVYSGMSGTNIIAGQLVSLTGSTIQLADKDTSGSVTGVSLSDVSTGEMLTYLAVGRITLQTFNLTPGAWYYLSNSGAMIETPPTTGYHVRLGQAQDAKTFNLQPNDSIKL